MEHFQGGSPFRRLAHCAYLFLLLAATFGHNVDPNHASAYIPSNRVGLPQITCQAKKILAPGPVFVRFSVRNNVQYVDNSRCLGTPTCANYSAHGSYCAYPITTVGWSQPESRCLTGRAHCLNGQRHFSAQLPDPAGLVPAVNQMEG